jgi:hypothetical protein
MVWKYQHAQGVAPEQTGRAANYVCHYYGPDRDFFAR